MKKIIGAATLLTLLTTAAQAQIAPGTVLLGGSLGYSNQSREGTPDGANQKVKQQKGHEFTFAPTGGYFVAKNLALGLHLSFSASALTRYQYLVAVPVSGTGLGTPVENGTVELKTRSLRLGPMARYYAFVGEKAAFFGQLGAGYGDFRSENSTAGPGVPGGYTNTVLTGSELYAQLMPGFAYFPTAKLALEASLQGLEYAHGKYEGSIDNSPAPITTESTASRFTLGVGLSNLQLGAAWYLGR